MGEIWGIHLYEKNYYFIARDKKDAKEIADKETGYSEIKGNPRTYEKEALGEAKDEMKSLHELDIKTSYGAFVACLIGANHLNKNGAVYIPELNAENYKFSLTLRELVLEETKDFQTNEKGKIVFGHELRKIKDDLKKIEQIEKYMLAREKLIKILTMIKKDKCMRELV